jgi:phospholipase/lecithinase/hemolysin
MKKLLALVISLLFFSAAHASNINRIIFFGDSLTDNGNLYRLLLKIIPKSPPYFKGRFSNGYTWAEYVGKHYHDQQYMDYKIYAYGGATTLVHLLKSDFISPTTLELEVFHYLLDSILQDKSAALFSIWIGGNDYMFDQDVNPNDATDKVVNKIVDSIKVLISNGGKHFLILNLPDLSRIPYIQEHGSVEKVHLLVQLHNQKLDIAIKDLKAAYPDVNFTYLDVSGLFTQLMDHPEIFNEKYNTHITNTTQACWQGKFTLSESNLYDDIKRTLFANNHALPKEEVMQNLSQLIMHHPELSYTYHLGQTYQAGAVPCPNASEYVYWDSIHPTETVHRVFSQIIIESLGNTI